MHPVGGSPLLHGYDRPPRCALLSVNDRGAINLFAPSLITQWVSCLPKSVYLLAYGHS